MNFAGDMIPSIAGSLPHANKQFSLEAVSFLRLLELKQKVRAHVAVVDTVPRHPILLQGPLASLFPETESRGSQHMPRSHHHFQKADAEPRTFIIWREWGRGPQLARPQPRVAKAWN